MKIGRSPKTWIATATIGSAVIGAGASAYGARKQAKADAAAQEQNRQAVERQNRLEWAQYLMSRGINPGGDVAPGQLPTSGSPMNSRLPLWASVRRGGTGSPRLVVAMPGAASPAATTSTSGCPARSFEALGIRRRLPTQHL